MDNKALFKLGYGLYVLSAREGTTDNGCIINTAVQVTQTPMRITIAVSKDSYTCGMIRRTGEFNLSVLDVSAPFSLFKDFGFRSGAEENKFAGYNAVRAPNGILYLAEHVNAVLCARVISETDLGTHILFLADLTDAVICGEGESVTYAYYQQNIKPAGAKVARAVWRCTVCGYIYEGDPLPEDFICPICKHGASVFVRETPEEKK